MSLWPIKIVNNIIQYELCDDNPGPYAPTLCSGSVIYKERISDIIHFFYEPSNDRLVAYAQFEQKAWPGWNALRLEWDADTGDFIKREWCGIWALAWHHNATRGSYNKLFDLDLNGCPEEVDWSTLLWESPLWKRTDIINLLHAVVNLQDNLLVGVLGGGLHLNIYDLTTNPATIRSSMRLPNTLGYLCMESREICWVITQDGLILKANYKDHPPRWEMVSDVQDPSPDAINYMITWDQKRGRLVVLRRRPDAEDGACQCQFEFYRPLIKTQGLTDPVPMSKPMAGKKTEFVAHLFGSSGEGISSYRVVASLQPTAKGELLQAESISTQNGAISFTYKGPADTGPFQITDETPSGEYTEHGTIGLNWVLHFDGFLATTPIIPGSVQIDVSVPDVPGVPGSAFTFTLLDSYTEGLLTRQMGGLLLDVGTINYETGAIHFEFVGQIPTSTLADYKYQKFDTLVLEATINDGEA